MQFDSRDSDRNLCGSSARSLPLEQGQALLDSFSDLPRSQRVPEVFLARLLYEETGMDLLAKFRLLDVVAETADRPYSQRIRFPEPRRSEPLAVSEAARAITEHLVDAKSIFSKPNGSEFSLQACGGVGVLRLSLADERVTVSCSEEMTLQRVILGLLPLAKAVGMQHLELDASMALKLPVESETDIPIIIEAVHQNLRGDRIVEDEVPICMFDQHTWEIRHILISSQEEEPEIIAAYCKVGQNGLVSNVSRGGGAVDPRLVVDALLEQQAPGFSSAERVFIRDDFLNKAKALAMQTNLALSCWFREALNVHYECLLPLPLFIRSVAIDVTGVWNPARGTLEPVVMEPNLSYGADGLKRVSIRNYLRVLHRLEQLEAEGYAILKDLFNPRRID